MCDHVRGCVDVSISCMYAGAYVSIETCASVCM